MDSKPCARNGEFSGHYYLEPDGLFVRGDEGEKIRVTWSWLRVMSRARTHESEDWSYTIAFENGDGAMGEVVIASVDLLGSGSAGLKMLASAGVEICPRGEKTLICFLRGSRAKRRDLLVKSSGWVPGRNLYVLPHQVIGDSGGERIIYQPEANSPTEASMRSSGTLQGWQENVAILAKGNHFFTFALMVAFAGSLLRSLGLDGGGFNIFGPSSRGKTTLLQMGASCFGNGCDPASSGESYVRRWNITNNAAEALGAVHNNSLLALDELGTFVGKGLDSLVYNLTGGQGKSAMTSSRQLQKQRNWTCLILSTGEISFRAKIEAEGGRVMAGQSIRMIDIAGGETLFHETHGMTPADFANRVKNSCSKWYGTSGPAFVAELISQMDEDAEYFHGALVEALGKFTAELTPEGLQPEQARAIRRFALLRLAGELAVQFGILPLTGDDVLDAVEFVRDRWIVGSSNDISDTDRAIRSLQGFITRNHTAFSSTRDRHARVSNSKGFFNGENGWYLFDDSQFQAAIGGHDTKETVRALRKKQLLVTHEGGRLKVKQKIACMGNRWIRFYAVKASILEVNFDSVEEASEVQESPVLSEPQKKSDGGSEKFGTLDI